MYDLNMLKQRLSHTTALVGIALLAAHTPAQAKTIGTATTVPLSLQTGDSLQVLPSGSVAVTSSGAISAVTVNGTFPASLINNGTISASSSSGSSSAAVNGILIKNGGHIQGGITNTGTITAIATGLPGSRAESAGILVDAENPSVNMVFNGGIKNSGRILGNAYGIRTLGDNTMTFNGGITNSGLISGASESGIKLTGLAFNGGVMNSGTIRGADAVAISVNTWTGDFVNTGTIAASGCGSSSCDVAMEIDTGSGGFNGNLVNSGTIVSQGSSAIQINSGIANFTGAIINESTGVIWGKSGDGIQILNSPTNIHGGIVNSGLIRGSSDGIRLSGNSIDVSGGIRNSGTILGGSTAIRVQSGARISGGITNSGTLTGQGGTAIQLNGVSAVNVPFVNIEGGTVNGDIRANNQAMTISGSPTINGAFTVNNLTIRSGSTLTFEVTGTTAGGTTGFGQVIALFNAINVSGSALQVHVGNNGFGTGLAAGQTFTIASGNATASGVPLATATPVASDSFLWNFAVEGGALAGTSDNDLALVISTGPGAAAAAASGGNLSIYNAIQALGAPANPQLALIVANVNGTGNTATLNNVLSAAGPAVDGGIYEAGRKVVDTIFDLADSRLGAVGASHAKTADAGTGMAAGSAVLGRSAWGQIFGQTGHRSAGSGGSGFTDNSAGFAMGADTDSLLGNAVLGAALSYSHTDVSSKNATADDGKVNSYQVSLYGDYDLGNATFLRGMAAYARNTNENVRHNVGGVPGLTATGKYDANEYALRLEGGRHYSFDKTTLTPGFLARYLGYNAQGYTETGAGGANLNVSTRTLNLFELGPTIEAAWNYLQADGSHFAPSVHAGYRYDLVGDNIVATSSFTGGGGSFTAAGGRPGRSRFNLGAEANLYTTGTWSFRAAYDFDAATNYTGHAGSVRATYRF